MKYKARFENVFNLMKSNNYNALKDTIDAERSQKPYDKEKFLAELIRANSELGRLTSATYSGFREFDSEGRKTLALTGSFIGSGKFIYANIYIDPISNRIVRMSYGR